MANYTIGDIIYRERIAKGYSQEELCFGICSTSTLSRIENNMQVPGKKTLDALIQRLGASTSVYDTFISRDEMELYSLTQRLAWKLENLEFEDAEVLAADIEERLQEQNVFEKQYLLFAKANILLHKKGDMQKVIDCLLAAIHITIPNFQIERGIQQRLLTFTEITIINSIALVKYDTGEQMLGIKLLLDLKCYMEEREIDEEEKAKKYPVILYNLATRLGKQGMYHDAYNLCEQGISFCVAHNKLVTLPYLLTDKACAAAELGKQKEAQDLFQQATAIFSVCKKEKQNELIKSEARLRYHIEL